MNEKIETGIEEIKNTAEISAQQEETSASDDDLSLIDDDVVRTDETVENNETESDGEDGEDDVSALDAPSNDGAEDGDADAEELTDAEKRRVLANPMFLTFAKGKTQGLEELISDFSKMLSLSGEEPMISVKSRATPSPSASSPDYALSERQRRIARDAGMSYREYYGFLKNMKTK